MVRNKYKRRTSDKIIIFVLIILLLISELMIFFMARNVDENKDQDYEPVNIIGTYETEDNFYFQKLSKKVVLITGLNGEDVQYVLLVVIDEDNKTMQPIQISRDALCEHNVLNEFGKIINQKSGPIRETFQGATDALVGLVNVKDAVNKMMCNARIDYYMSIDLMSADKITEIYDGIDVELYEDYTDLNPEYTKNSVVTIYPEDAIDFIIGNEAKEGSKRIEGRINEFINGFYEINQIGYENDSNYFSDRFAEVTKYCLFNSNDFIDYAGKTIWFKHLPIIIIDGSETNSGYNLNSEEIEKICLDTIYK